MSIRKAVAELIHTYNQLRPAGDASSGLGIRYLLEGDRPYCANLSAQVSMKKVVEKLGIKGRGYPVEPTENKIWSILIRLKDEQCAQDTLSENLRLEIQSLLANMNKLEEWTVGYLVYGAGSFQHPQFTIGRCIFQPWTPSRPMLTHFKGTINLNQIEARTDVEAADQDHAAKIGLAYVEEALNLLRYGSLFMGDAGIGNPQIGMMLPTNGIKTIMSTCHPVAKPMQQGFTYHVGTGEIDYNMVNIAPGWNELETVLKVPFSSRNDLQVRVATAHSWIGEANLLRSPAMRLVSIVTGLESLLLLPDETKGKKRKLSARVAAFPKLPSLLSQIDEAAVDEVYECRCDCVHGGQVDIPPEMERSALYAYAQSLTGLYDTMNNHAIASLDELVDKVCPESRRIGEEL